MFSQGVVMIYLNLIIAQLSPVWCVAVLYILEVVLVANNKQTKASSAFNAFKKHSQSSRAAEKHFS